MPQKHPFFLLSFLSEVPRMADSQCEPIFNVTRDIWIPL